ncbi:MAG: hypothetical protein QME12_07355 [Nanoarchaeota archaeon]|nr:hypothetical protein [Nanoarchaeota archaeon]
MVLREKIADKVSGAVNRSFRFKLTFNLIFILFIISLLSIGTFTESVKEGSYKPLSDKFLTHVFSPDTYLLETVTMEVTDNIGMFMRLIYVFSALLLFGLVISTWGVLFNYVLPDSIGGWIKPLLAYSLSILLIMLTSFVTILIMTGDFYFPLNGFLTWLANLSSLFKSNVTIVRII